MDDKKSKKTRPENKKAATSAATKTAVRATNAPKQKTAPGQTKSGAPAVKKPADNAATVLPDKSKEVAAQAKEKTPPSEWVWDKQSEKAWDKSQDFADKAKDKLDQPGSNKTKDQQSAQAWEKSQDFADKAKTAADDLRDKEQVLDPYNR